MGAFAEARKKADELKKQATAAIERAEQAAETSRDLLLELERLRKVPEDSPKYKFSSAD